MSNPVEAILSHYGKKGMKWGVRKASSGSAVRTERTRFSKAPSKLSDVELTKRIKRMEIEKKYNQLNRKDVSEGRQFASDVLKSAGRRVATTVLTGASLIAIKAAISAQFGEGVGEAATRRLK